MNLSPLQDPPPPEPGFDLSLSALRRANLLLPLLRTQVLDEALASIALTDEERTQRLEAWLGGSGLVEACHKAWEQWGWTDQDLEWQALRSLRMQRLARQRFAPRAEARFLERKDQLDLVTYSLIRHRDADLARELYLQLSSREVSFPEAARQYSAGAEKATHGLIGPRPMAKAHPQLAARLRTARDGELLEPFQINGWWLVVRREELKAATFDQAMADRMSSELLQEWVQAEAQSRLAMVNLSSSASSDHSIL